jgi:hypothetical protein
MSIRRGLLRLWLVSSIAWITVVGFHAYTLWESGMGLLAAYQPEKHPSKAELAAMLRDNSALHDDSAQAIYDRLKNLERLEAFERSQRNARDLVASNLRWGFGPPLAMLIIGGSLGWAFAGFRNRR